MLYSLLRPFVIFPPFFFLRQSLAVVKLSMGSPAWLLACECESCLSLRAAGMPGVCRHATAGS